MAFFGAIVIRMSNTFWKCLKLILIVVVGVEALSFAAMTLHNYILYGNIYSHVPVRYDPNTLFLMLDENPSADFNSVSPDPELNRIVWMFGGSTVRCNAHWDRNQTLPALLSKFLNKKAKPYHFTVVNYGENGFNSLLESRYLQKALADTNQAPHIVVFYDGGNDCFQYIEYREPEGHVGYRRLKGFIEGYRMSWWGFLKPITAAVYTSYTRELIDRLHMFSDPIKPDSEGLERMVELTSKRFDHVAKVLHCYDVEFLLVWQPLLLVEDCQVGERIKSAERTRFLDTEKFSDLKKSLNTTYDKFERKLENKPYFASLRNVLCDRTSAFYQPDGIHLTYEGNEEIARNLGQLLIDRFSQSLFSRVSGNQDNSDSGPVQ